MGSKAIILCATPRSGSTLLCDLMTGTGVLGRPKSWYRRQSIEDFAEAFGLAQSPDFDERYLAAVRRDGTDDSGTFAIRLMWDHWQELGARLARLTSGQSDRTRLEAAFGPAQFVFLSREDKVAQAVSRLRAEQSGLWHRATDGKAREQVGEFRVPQYDATAIATYVAEAEQDEAQWCGWFDHERITFTAITYEELANDPKEALAALLVALGCDPGPSARAAVRTQKLADTDSEKWAALFRGS